MYLYVFLLLITKCTSLFIGLLFFLNQTNILSGVKQLNKCIKLKALILYSTALRVYMRLTRIVWCIKWRKGRGLKVLKVYTVSIGVPFQLIVIIKILDTEKHHSIPCIRRIVFLTYIQLSVKYFTIILV